MCMTCMTGAEAMLLNGAGLTALGRVGLRRLRHGGADPDEAARARRLDEEFLRSMDLDPASVLGPAPDPPRPLGHHRHVDA